MACECGKEIYSKGLCKGCYRRAWERRNSGYSRRRSREWREKNPELYAKQLDTNRTRSAAGASLLLLFCAAIGCQPEDIARFIIETGERKYGKDYQIERNWDLVAARQAGRHSMNRYL